MWLSSREDGAWIGGGMVVGVRSLVVFGRCSRVISLSSWHWLRDLGAGVAVIDDERSSELSARENTSSHYL